MIKSSGFLRHFEMCNRCDLDQYRPFFVDDRRLGYIKPDLVALLIETHPSFQSFKNGIRLSPTSDSFQARSEALASAALKISKIRNVALRQEKYPLVANYQDQPLAEIDRAAVPWFGVPAFGVHVNGYVKKGDKFFLWIGERANNRRVDPGKLDNMIGGGQPIGLTVQQNLLKEAHEEAGLSPAVVQNATAVGQIKYLLERHQGVRNDTIFIFDLELPEALSPKNTDGEVAKFHLMPLEEVSEIVASTDRFKFNCNLVIVDFLIRRGFLPRTHPEFDAIQSYLLDERARTSSRTASAE